MKWIYKLKNKFSKRSIRFLYQRLVRGWDDSDTWSMDHTFATLILPRLKRFQELRAGYPSDMTEQEWSAIINEMIWGFDWFASGKQYDYSGPDYFKNYERANNAIELFAKHYGSLWW